MPDAISPLLVDCNECRAAAGEPCRIRYITRVKGDFHTKRREKAARATRTRSHVLSACACGSGQVAKFELVTRAAPPRRACGECAERAPLSTHVRRVP